jgi:tetratricopeptide (TPR) repeat protein
VLNLLGQPVEGEEFTKEHAEIAGIRTREALQQMILQRCANLPVVLFIDDLHWMDSASEALLRWAATLIEPLPLLILCTYRPQYHAPWAGKAHVRTLSLSPLDSGETAALLESRLAGHSLSAETAQAVMARAEGNPLFAEEMVNYLITEGEDGESGLPETLENLLMERVDRLGPGPRLVLHTAAVIGRRFSRELVAQVLGPEVDLDTAITTLEDERLIFHEPGDVAEYRFMHALVQDAIYQTLLKQRREELHDKVAQAIEASRDEAETEAADLLAHHYARTPRADKAAKFIALAAEKALRVYSLDEAEYRIRQVMDLIRTEPNCVDDDFLADILMVAGRVNYYRGDFKAQIAMMTQHLPLIEGLTDQKRRSRLIFEIGYALVFSGEPERGKKLLEEALAIGEAIDDAQSVAFCCMGLVYYHEFWNTDPAPEVESKVVADRGLDAAAKARDTWSHSKILVALLQQTLIFGRPNEAARYGEALFALSRETNDPRPRAMGLYGMALVDAYHFKPESALERADEALRLSLSRIDRVTAEAAKGTSLVELRRSEEAEQLLERGLAEVKQGGFAPMVTVIQGMLGVAKVLNGKMSEGVALIEQVVRDEVLSANQATRVAGPMILGEVYLEIAIGEDRPPLSVLLRNLAFVLTTLPVARSRAARYLESALLKAREMNAPSLIARLQYDLGRLAILRRRHQEARAAFAEARTLAESVGADGIIARIDAAA